MCLTTGVSWETFWTLSTVEVSALSDAFERVQSRRNKQR